METTILPRIVGIAAKLLHLTNESKALVSNFIKHCFAVEPHQCLIKTVLGLRTAMTKEKLDTLVQYITKECSVNHFTVNQSIFEADIVFNPDMLCCVGSFLSVHECAILSCCNRNLFLSIQSKQFYQHRGIEDAKTLRLNSKLITTLLSNNCEMIAYWDCTELIIYDQRKSIHNQHTDGCICPLAELFGKAHESNQLRWILHMLSNITILKVSNDTWQCALSHLPMKWFLSTSKHTTMSLVGVFDPMSEGKAEPAFGDDNICGPIFANFCNNFDQYVSQLDPEASIRRIEKIDFIEYTMHQLFQLRQTCSSLMINDMNQRLQLSNLQQFQQLCHSSVERVTFQISERSPWTVVFQIFNDTLHDQMLNCQIAWPENFKKFGCEQLKICVFTNTGEHSGLLSFDRLFFSQESDFHNLFRFEETVKKLELKIEFDFGADQSMRALKKFFNKYFNRLEKFLIEKLLVKWHQLQELEILLQVAPILWKEQKTVMSKLIYHAYHHLLERLVQFLINQNSLQKRAITKISMVVWTCWFGGDGDLIHHDSISLKNIDGDRQAQFRKEMCECYSTAKRMIHQNLTTPTSKVDASDVQVDITVHVDSKHLMLVS